MARTSITPKQDILLLLFYIFLYICCFYIFKKKKSKWPNNPWRLGLLTQVCLLNCVNLWAPLLSRTTAETNFAPVVNQAGYQVNSSVPLLSLERRLINNIADLFSSIWLVCSHSALWIWCRKGGNPETTQLFLNICYDRVLISHGHRGSNGCKHNQGDNITLLYGLITFKAKKPSLSLR